MKESDSRVESSRVEQMDRNCDAGMSGTHMRLISLSSPQGKTTVSVLQSARCATSAE